MRPRAVRLREVLGAQALAMPRAAPLCRHVATSQWLAPTIQRYLTSD
ncbi:hypothetical protein [Nonomuraea dietziae]|uniref:Uncharacterized protein n=1 Tax=Nonomuraea dietziae TaxID=65515 RepID=A0A7W5V355_9ACTN|nr:hypothetical protein [Nonomuraea dietziae]MBB3724789.1 hypothetical protein [Nonomuraea dietziae]